MEEISRFIQTAITFESALGLGVGVLLFAALFGRKAKRRDNNDWGHWDDHD